MKFRRILLLGAIGLSCKKQGPTDPQDGSGSHASGDTNTQSAPLNPSDSKPSVSTGQSSASSSSSAAPQPKLSCEEQAAAYQQHLQKAWPNSQTHGGLLFSVRVEGCAPFVKAIGTARPGTALDPAMPVRLGSYTQFLTAAALFKLEQEKKLELDQPMAMYLPKVKNAEITTLRQLMRHSSGYVDYSNNKEWAAPLLASPETPVEAQKIVDRIGEITPTVGDKRPFAFSYSNYFLLGLAIEKASQQKPGDYIKEKLLSPTSINGIELPENAQTPQNLAPGWELDSQGKNVEATQSFHPSLAGSAAAMTGSVEQVSRWTEAVFRGQSPLPPTAVGYMSRASVFDNSRPYQYSYGTKIWPLQDGLFGYGHDAQLPGYAMIAMTDPVRKVTVVGALTHRAHLDALRMAYRSIWSTAVQTDETSVLPPFETDPFLVF